MSLSYDVTDASFIEIKRDNDEKEVTVTVVLVALGL